MGREQVLVLWAAVFKSERISLNEYASVRLTIGLLMGFFPLI